MDRPLWKCPRCGARLVSKNNWHACGDYSIDRFLAGKPARARKLFGKFVSLIERCGPYLPAPAKTRVAFMAQVRFASVNRVADEAIDVHFVLPYALKSARFRRLEQVGPCTVHHLRLRAPGEMDAELQEWLRESYSVYGQRQWLERAQRSK